MQMRRGINLWTIMAFFAFGLSVPTRASGASTFIEVPGIVGESDTLGHPDVIRVLSYSLNANDFAIVKMIDSTSDDLLLASALGTQFPTVSMLFYNGDVLAGPPDSSLVFQTVLVSSYQVVGENDHVTFSFASVPEPASAAAAMMLLTCLVVRLRSRA